jgi:hypothetical protein
LCPAAGEARFNTTSGIVSHAIAQTLRAVMGYFAAVGRDFAHFFMVEAGMALADLVPATSRVLQHGNGG